MNKLKVLFGSILVLVSLYTVALSSMLPTTSMSLTHPVCVAVIKGPIQTEVGKTVYFDTSSSFCYLGDPNVKVPISSYMFNFGDGFSLSSGPTATHIYSSAGTYTVTVTVSANGWSASSSTKINVVTQIPQTEPPIYMPEPPKPTPSCINVPPIITSFNANPRFGTEPLTVTFNGSAIDPNGDQMTYILFYDWNRNRAINTTGTIGPGVKILGNYTYSAGDYLVKMDVSDSKNKTSRTVTIHVNASVPANHPPIACMTASDNAGYLPLTITFDGSCSYDPDGAIAYHTWRIEKENGAVVIEVQGNGSPMAWNHTFKEQGDFFVYLKVVDEQHEMAETNVTIRAQQNPLDPVIGWFRGEPSSGYAPLTVNFKSSAIGTYPLTYILFFSTNDRTKNVTGVINSTDSVLGTFLYISGGTFGRTYTAEIVVMDPLGRSTSKKAAVHVSPAWLNPNASNNLAPAVNFSYQPAEVFVGETVKFIDNSVDVDGHIIFWIWDFGDGTHSGDDLVSGEQNPSHTYAAAGNYTVTLKVYDNKGYSNLTRDVIEVKEAVAPPAPAPVYGGGGGSNMYLAPPIPPVITTSGTSYLGFHPSYALNGTRQYHYDNVTNTTTITLRIVNLLSENRTFTIKETIPKSMANGLAEVKIIPVPQTIYNADPEFGWNVTLAPKGAFEATYVFNKYLPFSEFEAMQPPQLTEIRKQEQVPVSPPTVVTIAGGGITGLVLGTLTNPWIGLLIALLLIAIFLAFTDTGKKSWTTIKVRTSKFVSDIAKELEEPEEYKEYKEKKTTERVTRLKKMMKAKRGKR